MSRIEQKFFIDATSTNVVELVPEIATGGAGKPTENQIGELRVRTSAATATTSGFWDSTGTCTRYNVIIERMT